MADGTTVAQIVLQGDDRTKAAFASINRNFSVMSERAADVGRRLASVGSAAGLSLGAIGLATVGAVASIGSMVKSAGDLQDIAEKTGSSAEAFGGLAIAAATGGVSLETVATASIKLSKNLTGVDDDSKSAGAALAALNIPIKEFKELDPVSRMERLAKALAGFKDGPVKGDVMEALVKGGAQLIPMLKALDEAGGRQVILTEKQIALADEYSDAQARSRAQLQKYAEAAATEALPAITALQNVAKDFIKDLLKLDETAKDVGGNSAIRTWAEDAGRAIARIADIARQTGKEIEVLADIAKIAGQVAPTFLLKGPQAAGQQLGELGKGFREKYNLDEYGRKKASAQGAQAGQSFVEAYEKAIAAGDKAANEAGPKKDKPDLRFRGAKDNSGAASDAAAAMRKALDGEIREARRGADERKLALDFGNALARQAYADGQTSQDDFFKQQNTAREQALKIEQDQLNREIELLREYADKTAKTAKPQERIDTENKIADAIARRGLAEQKAGQDAVLAAGAQARAREQLQDRYREIQADLKRLQGDNLGASAIRNDIQVGEMRKTITNAGGDQSVATEYGKQLSLTDQLADAQRKYADLVDRTSDAEQLALLKAQERGASELDTLRKVGEARSGALAQMAEMVVKARELADKLKTPEAEAFARKLEIGFKRATAEAEPLLEKLRDVGNQAGDAIANGLADGVIAGKSLKDTLKDIDAQLAKIALNELFTKPLKQWLGNALGGNGQASGGGGLLGGIFGKMFGGGNAAQAAFSQTAAGSSGFGTGLAYGNMDFGGFFAKGGSLGPGQWGIAGEAGAEAVFGPATIVPKDMLVDRGAAGGREGRSIVVNLNQNFAAGTDNRTMNQAAKSAAMALQRAQRIG